MYICVYIIYVYIHVCILPSCYNWMTIAIAIPQWHTRFRLSFEPPSAQRRVRQWTGQCGQLLTALAPRISI